ncbi:MAG: DegT/DnrJ/EryC1/StrS family aminotransferase [Bdellovibrionaceae bacterium]|jgi:dTDP-4-amino-4,6-dideoxygalactose transaminase|nr:DegT/DnrJ/EryC1/StrS family aminotransferase [Pseudobdellovibrionaceae bacterium]
MKVPFFNYQALYQSDAENYTRIFQDICSRGAYILQQENEDLEKSIAEFINVKHVFGLANGTDALIIALRAAGIQAGDEVILPSHTYIASPASVHFTGGIPVLTECGPDHMLDPSRIEEKITPNTKFIMPVQVNGRTCDMDQIMKIATDNNLQIVEDAAQALGSKWKGQCAGTFGAAGTFSFYPAKVLGCFGDGGALVTNDDKVAKQVSLLRDHGRDETGEVVAWGLNSRLDNLHAGILNHKLKNYKNDIIRRREIASFYNEALSTIAELTLPPSPTDNDDHFDVYQNYELEADRRDELKKFLADNGVGTIIQWAGTAVHQFKKLGFTDSLPITEKMTSRFLMLPMHTALSNEEVNYVSEKIREFYK